MTAWTRTSDGWTACHPLTGQALPGAPVFAVLPPAEGHPAVRLADRAQGCPQAADDDLQARVAAAREALRGISRPAEVTARLEAIRAALTPQRKR